MISGLAPPPTRRRIFPVCVPVHIPTKTPHGPVYGISRGVLYKSLVLYISNARGLKAPKKLIWGRNRNLPEVTRPVTAVTAVTCGLPAGYRRVTCGYLRITWLLGFQFLQWGGLKAVKTAPDSKLHSKPVYWRSQYIGALRVKAGAYECQLISAACTVRGATGRETSAQLVTLGSLRYDSKKKFDATRVRTH